MWSGVSEVVVRNQSHGGREGYLLGKPLDIGAEFGRECLQDNEDFLAEPRLVFLVDELVRLRGEDSNARPLAAATEDKGSGFS